MAASVDKLTIAEFERQYGDRKPYHEFWFGEAVPKTMPNSLHGILQGILLLLLREAGYRAGLEIKLKISSDLALIPDVVADLSPIEQPYPTKPLGVAIEILSPEDSFHRLVRKCRLYSKWGIPTIAVFDPEGREAWVWDHQGDGLKKAEMIDLENGYTIPVERAFQDLDAELR